MVITISLSVGCMLSTDTPTIIRAQSKRHTLAVARIPSVLATWVESMHACAYQIFRFSPILIRIRTWFGNLILKSCVLYVTDTHKIKLCLLTFLIQCFLDDQDNNQDPDLTMKLDNDKKAMLYIYKRLGDFGALYTPPSPRTSLKVVAVRLPFRTPLENLALPWAIAPRLPLN